MSQWTTADIGDLTGKHFIITGANSGLGAITAKEVAAHGARVTLACRNLDTAAKVANEIGDKATVKKLDLGSLESVRKFAADAEPADVLVNNAGVMTPPLGRTADGFETQFGTNHLGHFALTALLLDRISDRVVTVSSIAHNYGFFNDTDPNFQDRHYNRWIAYGQSKLANLMFGLELANRLKTVSSEKKSIIAHPGISHTGLTDHAENFLIGTATKLMYLVTAQSAAQGTLPQLYAATSPAAESGKFYGPNGFANWKGYPAKNAYRAKAKNPDHSQRLWELSERLTDTTFTVA